MPRILCGDLNCPLAELPDGRLVPYEQVVVDGAIVVRNRPMDRAEQALLQERIKSWRYTPYARLYVCKQGARNRRYRVAELSTPTDIRGSAAGRRRIAPTF
jgi:hypothetical protein